MYCSNKWRYFEPSVFGSSSTFILETLFPVEYIHIYFKLCHIIQSIPCWIKFFVLFVYLFSFFCFHLILMQIVKRGLNTNFLQDHLLAKYIMNNSRSQLHPVSYTQSIPLRFFHTLMGLKLPHFHKIHLLEFGDDKIG